jgi:hypothetical protein
LSQSVTISEELLQIREEGLDRCRGEPPSELLEHEREARGGEASLLCSIEEERAYMGRESH